MTPRIGYHLMIHSDVQPSASTFALRSGGNEVNVNAKAITYIGGIESMAQRLIAIWMMMGEYYQSVGYTWYQVACDFAQDLATVYNLTLWQTAQIIAVLSPQNPWNGKVNKSGKTTSDGNRLCAINVIKAWTESGEGAVMALRGWGYAPDFLAKCVRVLKGEELDWSGAPKTYRFALLIADPTRLDIAVCDSHASRIATGNLGGRYHVVAANAYALIERAYMLAASVLGIPAYVLQAGTWQFAVDGCLY